jgi:IS30 family transposase
LCNQESKRALARSLERAPSVVCREIARNSDHVGYLTPEQAYKRQQEKKKIKSKKIDRNHFLQDYIVEKVKLKWSPKTIAGRWNKKKTKKK